MEEKLQNLEKFKTEDPANFDALVIEIAKDIDNIVLNDNLYKISIQSLNCIIQKASPLKASTAKQLMSKAYQIYKSESILLLEKLDVEEKCEFTDLISIIGTISSSPILQKISNGPQNSYIEALKADSDRIFAKLIESDRQKALEAVDKQYTPSDLLRAANEGDLRTIVGAISNNKDFLNETDENGMNPLMLSAWKGHLDCVRFLLNEGCEIDKKTNIGSTALMLASEGGHVNVINLLIERGAQVNIQTDTGSTAASYAAFNDRLEALKTLVEHGTNVNIPDQNGATPLFCAVFADSVPCAEYLIDNGANIMAVNSKGLVPKQYAKTLQMIEFFKKFDF
ncbi:ankyrin repaeat protein, putative [Trichomonas vaginalis G3]|uniref:Ankyrin repaeat protein, putative n=1 Tax=Trichomonas vaginalis (strain ATCC PRA-98 / G3) TaxID=412133 RepID=A2F665_TRIV3|nr:protein ubiquitination [Trichomonas vaginalis G3]EAX99582.1 ankyrin repaeat protein, putative [Trichomonas vaginalis G3]KAI5506467.1 protein ubiquitination [Trichomonas vaginalis G3]|eukprot:XP_001312512.1 ankyrin repaeat protein [Trichomonas vaginalis G3]